MKKLIYICLLFSFLQQDALAQKDLRSELQQEIQKITNFDARLNQEEIPAYVIAVLLNDTVFIYGYGSTSQDSLVEPNGNTVFEIGGLTKVFTASLVNELVEKGELDYDKNLNDYLHPNFANEYAKNVTLLDLVTHTSGLPRMPLEFGVREKEANNPYAHYTKKDLIRFYKDYFLPKSKDTEYLYSNVGYAMLEVAMELVTQNTYEDLMKKHILGPIGMNDTRVDLTEEQRKRLAQGHKITGEPAPHWTFKSFAGSEGLKSSANDLTKFMQAQMGIEHQGMANRFETTHQIHAPTDISKYTSVAKGWHVLTNKKYYDVLVHTGTTSGSRVFLGFVKETKTGVVVLSNSEKGMGGLGHMVLKMINNNWKK